MLKPHFSDASSGVAKGDKVFEKSSDGTYASEAQTAAIGTGDGVVVTFTATLFKVRKSTLTALVDAVAQGTDNGAGAIAGAGVAAGTIDYDTGDLSVTFAAAPANGKAVTITYSSNTEEDPDAIRELELGINIIPVVATAHPLRVSWSVQAQLAAQAYMGLDVEDTISVVAGQFLKIERDRQIISRIATLAGAVQAGLTFDAAVVANLSRREVFNDFLITLAKADNVIFTASGRGGVSWIIAGTTACVVLSSLNGFVAEPNVVPIGAHVIGHVGNVVVIKDPFLTATDFLVGYNGILPGDAGVIVADWINRSGSYQWN